MPLCHPLRSHAEGFFLHLEAHLLDRKFPISNLPFLLLDLGGSIRLLENVVRYLQTNIIRVGCSAGSFLGSPRALSDNFLFHLWGHDEPDAGAVRVSDLRR
jgi:hypothetical protein